MAQAIKVGDQVIRWHQLQPGAIGQYRTGKGGHVQNGYPCYHRFVVPG